MGYDYKKKITPIDKILNSIDNLLIDGKEQKLKSRLGRNIRNSIFTEEIISKLNECDFTEMSAEEISVVKLFDTIFPIFIKKDNTVFRLYKHKIEVDLTDEIRDRYIYMFSDGRLTSGLFHFYSISDDEYVYGIKKIIDAIPKIKKELLSTITDYKSIMEKNKDKINNIKEREKTAEDNYNALTLYLSEKNSAEDGDI